MRKMLLAGAAAAVCLGTVAVHAQSGLFGTLLNEAKRAAEEKGRRPAPTPSPTPAQRTSPSAAAEWTPPRDTDLSPQYASLPAFDSFWPAPERYIPPSQLSQAPTPVAPGTPDSKCCGPQTREGKPAWVWSEYQLKTLSWGNQLPVTGRAGAPEQLRLNVNNSPVRQKWISTFDSWIRATYTPAGAVTAQFREIYPDAAGKDYVPINYGVTETLYSPVVKNGKVYRSPSPPFGWLTIQANMVPGHDAAWSINVPGQNYAFVMAYDRDFHMTEPREAGKLEAEARAIRARIGIDASVYLTSQLVVVMLTRDNKLPVRQMTIGETLDLSDAGIRRMQVKEPSDAATYAKRLETVDRLRAKYGSGSTAPAWIKRTQFSYQDFYTDEDLFGTGQDGNRYPLYSFTPEANAAAKSDTPAWIVIMFPRLTKGYDWAQKIAFETMADHFNYAYARDAIFDPQKVAGVAYAPRP